MPLPYTASLYHVYDNHFMPQLSILLNASGGYFMLSYAASSLCEECFALYFILLYAKVFFDTFFHNLQKGGVKVIQGKIDGH